MAVSCSCRGQPCRELPGWTWRDWPTSIGGDNRFLQHDSGVVARSLEEARDLERAAAERDEKHLREVTDG